MENRTVPYPHSWVTWYLCLCYFRINLTFESQQLRWLSNKNQMIWTSRRRRRRRRWLLPMLYGIAYVCVKVECWVEFSSNRKFNTQNIFRIDFKGYFFTHFKGIIKTDLLWVVNCLMVHLSDSMPYIYIQLHLLLFVTISNCSLIGSHEIPSSKSSASSHTHKRTPVYCCLPSFLLRGGIEINSFLSFSLL